MLFHYKDYSDGGLRTPNFIAVCKAIDCIWIKRLVNPRMHKWKWFALLELENIGGLSFLNGKLQRAAINNIKCSSFKKQHKKLV